MSIQIGQNIRKYRKLQGITQERLAEFLGVSHQAVSKWESGEVYPDIVLIPKIASIFHVTIDTLYNYRLADEVISVENIIRQVDEMGENNDLISAENLCREFISSHPAAYPVIVKLAVVLKTRFLIEKEKDTEWLKEAIRLCETVISESSDIRDCITATRTMAISYAYSGDTAKALEIADTLNCDYDNVKIYIYSGEEKITECKNDIKLYSDMIHKRLRLIGKSYANMGKNELSDEYFQLSEAFTLTLP